MKNINNKGRENISNQYCNKNVIQYYESKQIYFLTSMVEKQNLHRHNNKTIAD